MNGDGKKNGRKNYRNSGQVRQAKIRIGRTAFQPHPAHSQRQYAAVAHQRR